jgi:hypothetical protein
MKKKRKPGVVAKSKQGDPDDFDITIPKFDGGEGFAELLEKDDAKPALKPAWATVRLPKKLAFKDRPKKRIFYDFSEVEHAISRIVKLPGPNETIHAIMDSTFKGVDLVPAVIKLAKRPCARLTITTLGFNRRDIACIMELKQRGEILELNMVCSNFFAEKDMGAYNYAREQFQAKGCRIAIARNHSKLLMFEFGEQAYVVESSANLRSCVNFEQFALTNSRELYNFHQSWVSKMF